MGPIVDTVAVDDVVPAATTVAIIGGGIIGVSAALTLAARGVPVVLCEKGTIACEQSSRNWGWCRQAGRDEREMPLILESMSLWREMDRLTGGETGFRTCGVMYVGDSEEDEARFAAWLEMARSYDIGTRIVRGAQLRALMPGASREYRCGLHVPTDGCAEPQKAVPRARSSSTIVPCAASNAVRAACARSSPSGAASRATRSSWPAARGPAFFVQVSDCVCRSSRCCHP
jgi:glycine/D-amino acid oxidase-like deaminating enzyme